MTMPHCVLLINYQWPTEGIRTIFVILCVRFDFSVTVGLHTGVGGGLRLVCRYGSMGMGMGLGVGVAVHASAGKARGHVCERKHSMR